MITIVDAENKIKIKISLKIFSMLSVSFRFTGNASIRKSIEYWIKIKFHNSFLAS